MGGDGKVFVIAEAGVNHNGSLDTARKLVAAAAASGADAVKFQTFQAKNLVTRTAPKAPYQQKTTGRDESQFEMIRALELDGEQHLLLAGECRKRGILFLSTPFDLESLAMLVGRVKVPAIKISSGDIINGPLLLAAARSGKPVILSTGMSDLADIETALGILAFGYTDTGNGPSTAAFRNAFRSSAGQSAIRKNVTLLQCTTEYPAPYSEINLRAMQLLRETFDLAVGLSDHSLGIEVPIAAAALGATVIEKHFTLDRDLPGPDHVASLEPEELKRMVSGIRNVTHALGSPAKVPTATERRNVAAARKSLVAACKIRAGELFTELNLTVKRPGTGVSPIHYWDWLGKRAARDYEADEIIAP